MRSTGLILLLLLIDSFIHSNPFEWQYFHYDPFSWIQFPRDSRAFLGIPMGFLGIPMGFWGYSGIL